jgi:hypothetical protein
MPLPGGEPKGPGPAGAFSALMDLGAEAPRAAPECLSGRPPFWAPAACG